MHLHEWAKGFESAEGAEHHTARVRLLTPDDEVWHTWERAELVRPDWNDDAHRYLDALAAEYPLGRYTVTFLAEDNAGAVRSRLSKTVQGRNAGAKRGAQQDVTATSKAMESLSTQMARYMDMQHESQSRYQQQIEALIESNGRLVNQIIEERENGVRNQGGSAVEILAAGISQHLGPILQEVPGLIKFVTAAGNPQRQPMLKSVPKKD